MTIKRLPVLIIGFSISLSQSSAIHVNHHLQRSHPFPFPLLHPHPRHDAFGNSWQKKEGSKHPPLFSDGIRQVRDLPVLQFCLRWTMKRNFGKCSIVTQKHYFLFLFFTYHPPPLPHAYTHTHTHRFDRRIFSK